MTIRATHVLATLLVAAFLPSAATPLCAEYQEKLPTALENVGVDEHLDQTVPLDLAFRDHDGRIVKLGDYFHRGKPIILSLNYSSCPMLCNLQLTSLTNGLKEVEWSAGQEFEFVSISIDPREPVERANETREKYLDQYDRGRESWNFLVGRRAHIDAVAEAIGFRYKYLPDANEYAHPAAAVLCTPDGRISRYLYGIEYQPQMLRLSLVEASEGKIGTPGDQILLFCFHYDPKTGTYAPNAARLMMSVGGMLTVVLMAGGLFMLWSRESLRVSRPANSQTAASSQTAGSETVSPKFTTG